MQLLLDQKTINFTGNETEDLKLLKLLHEKYYGYLCQLSEYIVKDTQDAEEVVSDVFIKLWTNRTHISFTSSVKAYLCKAVRNTSLNYALKNSKITKISITNNYAVLNLLSEDNNQYDYFFNQETSQIIQKGIDDLPPCCKNIFLLSRNKDMSYNEIADHLSISVNTVKTQIKIALARLREKLINNA